MKAKIVYAWEKNCKNKRWSAMSACYVTYLMRGWVGFVFIHIFMPFTVYCLHDISIQLFIFCTQKQSLQKVISRKLPVLSTWPLVLVSHFLKTKSGLQTSGQGFVTFVGRTCTKQNNCDLVSRMLRGGAMYWPNYRDAHGEQKQTLSWNTGWSGPANLNSNIG